MNNTPEPAPAVLTKEGFWNEIEKKYPGYMEDFKAWIDKYKERVRWDELFGNVFPTTKKIKFHDLPTAMQIGIFIQYTTEAEGRFEFIEDFCEMSYYVNQINEYFWHEDDWSRMEHQEVKHSEDENNYEPDGSIY